MIPKIVAVYSLKSSLKTVEAENYEQYLSVCRLHQHYSPPSHFHHVWWSELLTWICWWMLMINLVHLTTRLWLVVHRLHHLMTDWNSDTGIYLMNRWCNLNIKINFICKSLDIISPIINNRLDILIHNLNWLAFPDATYLLSQIPSTL